MKQIRIALLSLLLLFLLTPAYAGVNVRVAHSIMPAIHGAVNVIRIQLDAPPRADGGRYPVTLQSNSSGGLLSSNSVNATPRLQLSLAPQEWVEVHYRWNGPVPTQAAHQEQLSLEVPDLKIHETINISIGIDLAIRSVETGTLVSNDAKFLPVRIFVHDRFHPEANLEKVLETWGIQPELRLTLTDLNTGKPHERNQADPVVRHFFGTSSQQASVAWPAGKPEPGKIKATDDGQWRWTSLTGQEPGITPQPGTFQLKAHLWPKTGIAGIREGQSAPFTIPGGTWSPSAPGLIGSTLRILAEINDANIQDLDAQIHVLLNNKNQDAAIRLLGSRMRELFKNSSLHILGHYAQSLTASAADTKEIVRFLQMFMQGYTGYGLIIATPPGIASLSATDSAKTTLTDAPNGLKGPGNSKARIYRGKRLTVIPFTQGETLILRVKGSGKAEAQLWKVMPEGINAKNYPAGPWEKEITVYGDRLTPPAPK